MAGILLVLVTNLFTKFGPRKRNHAAEDGVRDKRLVVHEFVRSERRDSVKEQAGGELEVANCHTVGATVDLESISPIPVSTFVYQPIKEYARTSRRDNLF